MPRPVTLAGAAIVVAGIGAANALSGNAAAGVVFVALAVAIACTALRHLLRKDAR